MMALLLLLARRDRLLLPRQTLHGSTVWLGASVLLLQR